MIRTLLIIPCYNEGKNISKVIQAIENYILLNSSLLETHGIIIDYIVINDCSKDNTLDVLMCNRYNYLKLPVNLGIGGGVQTGYIYAKENGYDIAIQHDGDGQHDPKYFVDLISIIEFEAADIVVGSRFIDKKGFQSTWLRRFGIIFLSKLIYLCSGVKVYDVTSGYRAVNRKYIEFFATCYAQDYPEPESLIEAALNNAKIVETPVVMHERKEGKSSINALGSLYYMVKVSLAILLHRLTVSKKSGV